MIEQIEKIKSEYTDKYVAVDASRAELARFKDLVGQVKTVNMSGRALVEFIDYHLSTGWFDIDLDYLKVVDKPAPKPKEEKKPAAKKKAAPKKDAAKPQAEKKLSPLEMARQQGSAGKDAAAAKKPKSDKPSSTSDILAAARGGAAKAAPKQEAVAKTESSPKPQAAGKVDRGKMSVADMLAAARGGAAAAPAETEQPRDEVAPEDSPAAEEVVEEAAPAASEETSSGGPVDKSSMSIDDMLAYCREHDA
ncbi:hypothetical protein [Adhaeretor mobilis]|nr:hypothetical protein [Adhaeretor mobilis]